jgi:protein-disulfide isomerase-like protein with CxxC motif
VANIRAAIEDMGGMALFQYRWLPYLLNPDTPAGGMTIDDYMAQKGYPKDFYPKVKQRLYALGKQSGIEFNHEAKHNGGKLVVSMVNALRLIDFAQATLHPTQVNELVEAVIWAHHVHGKDVSDSSELVRIGATFGLGTRHVKQFIADPHALAPAPGSPEALAAVVEGMAALVPCNATEDNNTEHDTCVAASFSVLPPSSALAMPQGYEGDGPIGDVQSIRLRDQAAKRERGIHAVPHIELWRDTEHGTVGVDCRGPLVSRPQWIKPGSAITGLSNGPIVIEGANPVASFLGAFRELSSITIPV